MASNVQSNYYSSKGHSQVKECQWRATVYREEDEVDGHTFRIKPKVNDELF